MSNLIEEFRSSHGEVDSPYHGSRLLLLTTFDVAEDVERTVLVPFLRDVDRLLVIAADDAGVPPAWFGDLLVTPRVTIEFGRITQPALATVLDPRERDQVLSRAAEADPAWLDHAADLVSVVALQPENVPPAGPLGDNIVAIHNAFRRELAVIRKELVAAGGGPSLVAQLRVNCLALCQWVTLHHTGEGKVLFPMVAAANPELAPVLERLGAEHEAVRAVVDRLAELLRQDGPGGDLVAEFDRLTADLEAHLAYEESQVIGALNALRLG